MANKRSGRRADLRWTLGSFVVASLAAGASASFAVIPGGITSQTIMRVRGSWSVWMDSSTVAADVVRFAIGLLTVQSGATAASLPLTDGEAPFFWYDIVTLAAEEVLGGTRAGMSNYRAVIDGKAMRVLRPDRDVLCVMESADVVGATVLNAAFDGRFLLAD